MLENKKAQGLVTGIVSGIGFLVITVIVIFLITSTLNGAGLIEKSTLSTAQNNVLLITSGTELTECAAEDNTDVAISAITVQNLTVAIVSANYTTSGCTITGVAGSEYNNTLVNITAYSYNFDADAQVSADQMINNFTIGVNNVSNKLPTVLLVAAVVLLFGAIVLLVKQSRTISGNGGAGL